MRRANGPIGAAALGLGLGLALVGIACGAATPEPRPTDVGTTPIADLRAEQAANDSGPPEAPSSDAGASPSDGGPGANVGDGGCPYGRLEDPHRGFVRCLAQNEADAGWLPPSPQGEPGDAGASAPAVAQSPPTVEVGDPAFENGDVPNATKFLNGLSDNIAKCIGDHGGLSGSAGKMKLQFLVRARGRAEGVEVVTAKGVNDAAKECVRVLLKNRQVGTPSADPVGVTVTVTLGSKGK